MNEQVKSTSVSEFNSVMSNIQSEIEIALKDSDLLYQIVCKLEGFDLQTKGSEPLDAENSTLLHRLKEVYGTLSHLNAKNNEILIQLKNLI